MLRIVRSRDDGGIILTVSGRIGADQLPELRRSVQEAYGQDVVLDLVEVGVVDVEAVRFLLQCEAQGVRISGCPAYVRAWMAREQPPP
jgi:anti-anti-sigma regulatory factor